MTLASIARVLVVSPLPQLDRLFDYRVPESMEGVEPGVRVTVPLRTAGRTIDGFVVELAHQVDYPGPLSDIESVVSSAPVLRPEVYALLRAAATRAAGSASDLVRVAIPTRQVRVEKAWLARREAGGEAQEEPDPPSPSVGPESAPGTDPVGDSLPVIVDFAAGAVESLIDEGRRAALQPQPGMTRLTSGAWVGRWAVTLAQCAARAHASGGSALIAVPDYRDQQQVVDALAELVDADDVVRWDARQSNPDRYRGLLRTIEERPAIVVGTRSVIYAPATRLGLIAIWNDGDPLFTEPLAPYVHTRDAALLRQEQQGSALILAAQTRTTEAQRLVEVGWLDEIRPERPRHPKVIPTANVLADDRLAEQARIPPLAWRAARAGLADGPVLIQVGRPGFSPGLFCADCGERGRCRRCAGPLRLPRAGAAPTCLWCGVTDPAWRCPNCRGGRLRGSGSGSVRTAEELGRAFPGVRVIVSDGERPVTSVPATPALVIATRGAEPLAEGGYRAILLLDGERMVARESLRVGEDCLRWWSDATALAADDATTVLVGVGGALGTALSTWRQADYARSELADRRALRFPPAVRSVTLTGSPEAVTGAIERIAGDGVDVLGPTPHDDGVRAIIRVDYGRAGHLAEELRAEVVRLAGSRRKPAPGLPRRGRQPVPLRVRFDDPDPFEE